MAWRWATCRTFLTRLLPRSRWWARGWSSSNPHHRRCPARRPRSGRGRRARSRRRHGAKRPRRLVLVEKPRRLAAIGGRFPALLPGSRPRWRTSQQAGRDTQRRMRAPKGCPVIQRRAKPWYCRAGRISFFALVATFPVAFGDRNGATKARIPRVAIDIQGLLPFVWMQILGLRPEWLLVQIQCSRCGSACWPPSRRSFLEADAALARAVLQRLG